ncbi:MAG: ATP-binding protein, partial [Alphaproteobacteria bacterium]|nr:ATP-binding protein [Alphaproteobacteria bacterium]
MSASASSRPARAVSPSRSATPATASRLKIIFEPFQEGTAGHARVGRGAGLGLWLSHSLIELHGGALTVDSRRGEGTVATV